MTDNTSFSNSTNPPPADPDASKLVDVQQLQSTTSTSKKKNDSSGKSPEDLSTIDVASFLKRDSVLSTLAHFHTLQGIFDHALNHLRAPTAVSDRFMPYTMVYQKNGHIPAIGSSLYIGDVTTPAGITSTGAGSQNFTNWIYNTTNPIFNKTLTKCCVKWDVDIVSNIMAVAQSAKERYPTDGVRDVRARPEYVLSDWGVFLTDEIDTTFRTIRTDTFARFMYGSYDGSSSSETVYIVNATDLRTWLNTHNAPCPLPTDTLVLDLSEVDEGILGKLSIFDVPVVINVGLPLVTPTSYLGLPAAAYTKAAVSANDVDIAKILSATYDAQEIELAIFLMAQSFHYEALDKNAKLQLETHTNTIQEQMINYFASGIKHKARIPAPNGDEYLYFVQSFRLAKTMMEMKAAMKYGFFGRAVPGITLNAGWSGTEIINALSGFFSSQYISQGAICPIWIPFEFWIANGANLTLDPDSLTVNVTGRTINTVCTVPRSIVGVTIAEWDSGSTKSTVNYYQPNSSGGTAIADAVIPWLVPCYPETIPRIGSLTGTMTATVSPSTRVYVISPVKSGYNANYIQTRSLGF